MSNTTRLSKYCTTRLKMNYYINAMLINNSLKVINFRMCLQKLQNINSVDTNQWRGLKNIYKSFHVSNKLVIVYQPGIVWHILSIFLASSCYFTCLTAQETNYIISEVLKTFLYCNWRKAITSNYNGPPSI